MGTFTKQKQNAPLGSGTTRAIDVSIDSSGTASVETLRFRGGVTLTGIVINGSAVWAYAAGRRCISVPTGLFNGLCLGYSMPLTIERPSELGAVSLRSGIVRLVSGMMKSGATGGAPNSDIGIDVLIGNPGGISDLWTSNNSHASGSSGYSLQLAADATWRFRVKQPDTPAAAFSEDLLLSAALQATLDALSPSEIEFRHYDATVSEEAKMELYINAAKILTRYWVNPPGVLTATLPPMGALGAGCTGSLLQLQLRNTSVGPPAMFFFEPSIIQGPNDAGTL